MNIPKDKLKLVWDTGDPLYDDVEEERNDDYTVEGYIRRSGVPPLYRGAVLSDFGDKAEEYGDYAHTLTSKTKGAFLTGSVGSGKTHLMSAILRARQERFTSTNQIFVNHGDLLYELRELQGTSEYNERIQALREVQVLYIDDFAMIKHTDWAHEVTYLIVNHRYVNMLPLFVSTNLSLDVLREKLPRIHSRLFQMCDFVLLREEDRRVG